MTWNFRTTKKMLINLLRPWSECQVKSFSLRDSSLAGDQINPYFEVKFIHRVYGYIVLTQKSKYLIRFVVTQRGLCYAKCMKGRRRRKTNLLCKALRYMITFNHAKPYLPLRLPLPKKLTMSLCHLINFTSRVTRAASTLIEDVSTMGWLVQSGEVRQAWWINLKTQQNEMDQQSEEWREDTITSRCYQSGQRGDLVTEMKNRKLELGYFLMTHSWEWVLAF
jgi:hypothetical protein